MQNREKKNPLDYIALIYLRKQDSIDYNPTSVSVGDFSRTLI
jgi:hypothetical protein